MKRMDGPYNMKLQIGDTWFTNTHYFRVYAKKTWMNKLRYWLLEKLLPFTIVEWNDKILQEQVKNMETFYLEEVEKTNRLLSRIEDLNRDIERTLRDLLEK